MYVYVSKYTFSLAGRFFLFTCSFSSIFNFIFTSFGILCIPPVRSRCVCVCYIDNFHYVRASIVPERLCVRIMYITWVFASAVLRRSFANSIARTNRVRRNSVRRIALHLWQILYLAHHCVCPVAIIFDDFCVRGPILCRACITRTPAHMLCGWWRCCCCCCFHFKRFPSIECETIHFVVVGSRFGCVLCWRSTLFLSKSSAMVGKRTYLVPIVANRDQFN